MLMIPACPQPVRTTRPLPATWAMRAWSSRISGSGAQMPLCRAWWMGNPCSNLVVRSTSPVMSTERSNRNEGWRFSMMSNPAPSSARRLVVGSSKGSMPGMGPDLGVDDNGHAGRPEPADEPGQPGRVVEVTVAADDHLDVSRVAPEAAQVVGAAGRSEPGVEQQPAGGIALADLDQNGESVVGHRPVARFPL